MNQPLKQIRNGFTLVEMMIVLLIVGIVVFGLIQTIPEQTEVKKQLSSESTLKILKQSMLKFSMINNFLPCPDTDLDGFENRVAVNNSCVNAVGTIPFKDLGLTRKETFDAYQNDIRYAVHIDSVNPAQIVNNTSPASYFGLPLANGQSVYDLNTPPTEANLAANFYTVCTPEVNNCAAGLAAQTVTAVAVLVAYNNIGPIGNDANCLAAAGTPSGENCNVDLFYHQARKDVNPAVGVIGFDDSVEFISGYELKSQSSLPFEFWTTNPVGINVPPTFAGYRLDLGGYVPQPNTQDVIQVDSDITTALNLGGGDDIVAIGNDLSSEIQYNRNTGEIISNGENAALDTGDGNDTVYIQGSANSDVTLGIGNDRFVLGESLTKNLSGGAGNDQIWIQDNVQSNSNLNLGSDDDVLTLGMIQTDQNGEPVFDLDGSYKTTGGDLNENIYGGSGTDVLVLEHMTRAEWDSNPSYQSYVRDFEVIVFKANVNSSSREYLAL